MWRLLALAAWSAVFACQGAAPRPSDETPTGASGPGLEARAFFQDPALDRVALSPDGSHIAALAIRDGVQVVLEMNLDDRSVRYLKKIDEPGMWVRSLGWSGDEVVLVAFDRPQSALAQRTRTSRMLALRLDGRRPRDYGASWTYQSPTAQSDPVIHWLPEDRDHVLVTGWSSSREGATAQRVSVRSGVHEEVVPEDRWMHTYHADADGLVRAAVGKSHEGSHDLVYARSSSDEPFTALRDANPVREDDLEFAGFGVPPERIHVRAVAPHGRRALYEYDLSLGERGEEIHSHPEVDVGAIHLDARGAVVAVEVSQERPSLHFFDPEAERIQAALDRALPDATVRVEAWSRDGERALVRASGDVAPPRYFVHDVSRGQMRFLFAAHPGIDTDALSPMRPVQYPARDGLVIPAYLTLPRGLAARGLPTLVIPHDGPSHRDHWGWNATVQFLASRGFAVLQPNFRGSRGYGRDHEDAGYDQWGGAMQDDLIDGVTWLVEQGIADPSRVGMFGVGYGGYAALMGVADAPQVFSAAASLNGVTDLVALIEHPEQLRSRDFNRPVISPLPRHRRHLTDVSPARRAASIRAPVFLAHGAEDPVVDVAQTHAMRRALERRGNPAETHIYPNELHHFLEESNRIDFHERLAAFFEKHLAPGEAPAAAP